MRLFATIILAAFLCGTATAQTLKSLMYNTTNGRVAYSGTNILSFVAGTSTNYSTPASFANGIDPTFAMSVVVADEALASGYDAPQGSIGSGGNVFSIKYGAPNYAWASPLLIDAQPQVYFGATWLTNTNVTNFRTAIGLGVSNSVIFNDLILEELSIGADGISFQNEDGKANTRANLSLGPFNGDNGFAVITDESNNAVIDTEDSKAGFYAPFHFFSNPTNAAISRTNLGIPLDALTNTSNVTMMRALAGSTNTNHPYSGSYQISVPGGEVNLVFSNGILQDITQ